MPNTKLAVSSLSPSPSLDTFPAFTHFLVTVHVVLLEVKCSLLGTCLFGDIVTQLLIAEHLKDIFCVGLMGPVKALLRLIK